MEYLNIIARNPAYLLSWYFNSKSMQDIGGGTGGRAGLSPPPPFFCKSIIKGSDPASVRYLNILFVNSRSIVYFHWRLDICMDISCIIFFQYIIQWFSRMALMWYYNSLFKEDISMNKQKMTKSLIRRLHVYTFNCWR